MSTWKLLAPAYGLMSLAYTGLHGRHLKGKGKGNSVFWGEKAKFETKNRKAQDREICDVTGILG